MAPAKNLSSGPEVLRRYRSYISWGYFIGG